MSTESSHFYEFGRFRLIPAERLLLRDGEPVKLKPIDFEMLVALVERSGRLVEKRELLRTVWPEEKFVAEANLTNSVYRLRNALGGGQDDYIETVPKHGYRFVAAAVLVVEKHTRTQTVTEEDVPGGGVFTETAAPHAPRTLRAGAVESSRARRVLPFVLVLLCLSAAAALAHLYRPWASRGTAPSANGPDGVGRSGAVAAAAAVAPPPRTIAVLPFKIIGAGQGDEEYLGLGMTDAIITRLGHSRQLVVRPTSAVRRYADPRQDPVEAGRQQGVEAVLDGSVQRSGERIRVTARLIRVAGGESIWSGQFDEPLTDVFAVQDSISRRVMSDLPVELKAEERERFERRGTESAEAYRAYLKGRYFWNKRTNEGQKKAIEHFNRALEIDPAYAQAYAGLADAYLLLAPGQREAVAMGRAALRRAVELDETLAEAHASLGMLASNFDHDWAEAEREYRRAIELNPNNPTARHRYGEFLAHLGRFDEGLAEIRRAQELDPLSLIISADTGKVYLLARQYDRAIEQCRRTLEMDPNFNLAHAWLGFAYSLKGQHEAAIAEFKRLEGLEDDGLWLSFLGYAYGAAGRRAEAQRVLQRMTALSKKNYLPPSLMVLVYAGMGERDEAFEWAERMFEEQDFVVLGLKVNPVFDGLRPDPRYADLLRRARLT